MSVWLHNSKQHHALQAAFHKVQSLKPRVPGAGAKAKRSLVHVASLGSGQVLAKQHDWQSCGLVKEH
eukprot:scaffold218478_cov13-Tisochrysis_lutea.AAC.1